ncbi:MAG: hypothetical protein Q7V20_21155 [Aquabacterium sp.]|nr:hypothetical protein [Aquabacterium sp.]MDO9005962.1 hypothetical protein [Aquabacterium sp.]
MKTLGLYALIISLASLAAAVLPTEDPAEMHVALAIGGRGSVSP